MVTSRLDAAAEETCNLPAASALGRTPGCEVCRVARETGVRPRRGPGTSPRRSSGNRPAAEAKAPPREEPGGHTWHQRAVSGSPATPGPTALLLAAGAARGEEAVCEATGTQLRGVKLS